MEQTWFRTAIFYSLDVESFIDGNGDGIGDFIGLTGKLEYIASLGANCIWLLPFFSSPNRDNGYDVMDYYNVDHRLGTLGDFTAFLIKAEQLGIRVVIDLVVNHTSVQHPWFQQARADKNSPYRDYYVWSDKPLEFKKEQLMLHGEENTIWTYDEAAGEYYLHRFYKEQPDLNIHNPEVKKEILKIMGFWLRLGVNGFRIDATQLLVDPYGVNGAQKDDLVHFINEMRDYAQTLKGDALLLAEVNAAPDEMHTFLQQNERMHMLFNFFVNQHLFLALAEENKTSLEKALKKLPPVHPQNQWLNFLRHHDEMSLRLLPPGKQKKVFAAFAPREEMKIFDAGIRRRLSPMLGGNMRKIRLAYSLLFSLPGAVMIRYGDEIGMGDDLGLPGRNSVRTPMQWCNAENGGFSAASAGHLVHPVIKGGRFGYEKINVITAQQQPDSLLNWLERLITTRKQCAETGNGKIFFVPHSNKKVLIHRLEWKDKKLYCLHNLSGTKFTIFIKNIKSTDEELFPVFGNGKISGNRIALSAYGYYWLSNGK
jgi:maltose alpha-D-glucosyltransferase/alpha-amylase